MAMPSPEPVEIKSGTNISKIGTIKTFKHAKGARMPVLKKGELATDGESLYLCFESGNIGRFLKSENIISKIESEFQNHLSLHHAN